MAALEASDVGYLRPYTSPYLHGEPVAKTSLVA